MVDFPEIKDQELLNQALTHRSYVNEHPKEGPKEGQHNERLEFLGDAVLGFLVGELLFSRYPDFSEAQLTRLRSLLVDEKQLAKFAQQVGVGNKMRLGRGAEKNGARENPSLLSDTFEAVIGAYFLDQGDQDQAQGIEAVRTYIEPLLVPVLEKLVPPENGGSAQQLIDYKNRFQQWALKEVGENPTYEIISESGPDHAKEFMAKVKVKNKSYGKGRGRKKQDAEKQAAQNALKELGLF